MESKPLTIEQIVLIEPRIAELLKMAQQTDKEDWSVYNSFKHQLFSLVGVGASKKEVRNWFGWFTHLTWSMSFICL